MIQRDELLMRSERVPISLDRSATAAIRHLDTIGAALQDIRRYHLTRMPAPPLKHGE